MPALAWTHEGRGRYTATGPGGEQYVIVPEHGHYGNNVYGYQAYRVGPGDQQQLVVSARRLKAVFAHFETM